MIDVSYYITYYIKMPKKAILLGMVYNKHFIRDIKVN